MNLYQQFIYKGRYARWNEELGRREELLETVERFFTFFSIHLKEKYNYLIPVEQKAWLKRLMLELEVMPSMRAVMTAGPALKRENMAGYNCSFIPVDDAKAFDELLYVLMNGTGVGFSVEQQNIEKLGVIPDHITKTDTCISIGDSKEGWAKGLRELIALLYAGHEPEFDVSKVRPAGARLVTFGGRASGPGPLLDLFKFTIAIFKRAVGRKLTSLECHDIVCKIAEVVVVGGVRRSALISLSDLSDNAMQYAKTGQWWIGNSQRALANNSAVYNHTPAMDVFFPEWCSLYESKSGERGIFNRDAAKRQMQRFGRRNPDFLYGTNPCVSADTLLLTDEGNFPIGDLIGEKVKIWNGFTWSEVIPFGTGLNATYTIAFSNGKTLTCTPYHEFILAGNRRIEARWLNEGDILEKFDIPGNRTKTDPYTTITDIVENYGVMSTFCVTEPLNHSATFNGIVTGQCGEALLRPLQTCNLTEVIIKPYDTVDSYLNKVKAAAILGTWQSTLDDFKYLRKKWSDLEKEERLLGVSLSGVFDNPLFVNLETSPQLLAMGRGLAVRTNKKIAAEIGINQSVGVTLNKPSGTVSQLVDCASGCHARHSEYYIRTVRGDKNDPLTQFLIDNKVPYEDCVLAPNSTVVFSFPQKAPESSVTRHQLSALHHLEIYKLYKEHWCEHNPSITITVKEHEWLDVGAWVYKNMDNVIGLTFLPHTDHSYQQAPYQDCTEEYYNQIQANFPTELDWNLLKEYEKEDNTVASQELACAAGFCEIV